MVTSYKAEQIQNRLLDYCSLMVLQYDDIEFDIDPFHAGLFHIHCNGDEWNAHSLDEVMGTPFIKGKCLKDIAEEVQIIDW